MNIFDIIAEFCSNVGYATILGAVIGGIFVVVGIVITHRLKKREPLPPLIIIPPEADPLSGLASNPGGLKDIDNMDITSKEYSEALALRLELMKNPDSVAEVYHAGEER